MTKFFKKNIFDPFCPFFLTLSNYNPNSHFFYFLSIIVQKKLKKINGRIPSNNDFRRTDAQTYMHEFIGPFQLNVVVQIGVF